MTHIESKNQALLVHTETSDGACTLACDHVFIGAGCVNTTAIMDRSLFGLGRRSYTIKSTAILLQLYLCLGSIFEKVNQRDVDFLTAKGLCHLFVEHRSRQTQGYWSHTQISHLRAAMHQTKNQTPIGYLSRSMDPLLKKMRFSITSFHSDFGPRVELLSSVQKDGRGHEQQTISIVEPPFNCPNPLVFSLKRAIMSRIRSLGLLPLPMSMRFSDWLRRNRLGGWHYGGSLPMTDIPAEHYQCYPNGENKGLPGVFIIDSSGFPSIPGSSVALLTMANSHRIAKNYISNIEI